MTAGARAGGWRIDALLYGASAVFAGITAVAGDIPLQREWGRTAVWGYAAATAVAGIASLRLWERDGAVRARAWLAAAVFVAGALVPLAIAASERAEGDPGYAQSEVIVVEEAADAALDGRNPYAARFGGPLADRSAATRTHVPYPPAMLLFGLPRAIAGHAPWADARVWFTVVAAVVAVAGVLRMPGPQEPRILVLQVLLVLPTGAALLATGGDDVPVVAMLLATAVLAARGAAVGAGIAGGVALAMKQTSILVLPFLALAIADRVARRRAVVTGAIASLVLVVPVAFLDLGAFVEDTVLFPVGLGRGDSAAATPTLGSILIDRFPSLRTALTIALVGVALALALLVTGRGRSTSELCLRAAAAFAIAIGLAPAARFGYLVYPANLLAWAIAFREVPIVEGVGAAGSEVGRGRQLRGTSGGP